MNDKRTWFPARCAPPQARHLNAERMAAWWQAARALAATDAFGSSLTPAQQLRRLAGFGASEIGILVGEQRGLYSPFSTAREVVARKLLLDPPTPANPHQRRGILLEPLIRETFLRQSGAIRNQRGRNASRPPPRPLAVDASDAGRCSWSWRVVGAGGFTRRPPNR